MKDKGNEYEDAGIDPDTKCAICGGRAEDIVEEYGPEILVDSGYSEKLGGWVCHPCIESCESAPQGTVVVYDPAASRVDKYVVMDHEDLHFSAEGVDGPDVDESELELDDFEETSPIQFAWKSTDPWRGYYEAKADGWTHVAEDCILHFSEDAGKLEKFDDEVKQTLWGMGAKFALVFGRTSNLFSTGYDVYVERGGDGLGALKAALAVNALKAKYRDPTRFAVTALTGGYDKDDRKGPLLAEAYERLKKGEDFESVKDEILKRAAEAR